MQLDLGVSASAQPLPGASPRVVAVCIPDLPLQRTLRAREAAALELRARRERAPIAIEREARIIACDAAARERGVRPGDSVVQARAACAELDVVTVDEGADRVALEAIAEAMLALAPAVEVAWPDTLLLDASGAHLLGNGLAEGETVLAQRAMAVAADLGLRCRVVVASGRAPARALARYGGATAPIPPSEVPNALAALPIDALGLDASLGARIAALGLRQVADLARLPPESLAHRFGPAGLAGWRLAQGDDPSPLVPYLPVRLPEEQLDLEAPVESSEPLLFALKRMCDRIAVRLAGRGLGATRLVVALRLDPRDDERLDVALAVPSSAASRWLLVLRERLSAVRLAAPVVGVTLSVAAAAPAPVEQLAIGDRPQQLVAIETVLARLAARLGEGALFAAAPVDRHRPEAAYQAGAFTGATSRARTFVAESPRRQGAATVRDRRDPAAVSASPPVTELVRPTRLLCRPQPLVALGEGGRLTAVRLGGQTLRVLALSPAERLAGEWWSDPFDRDYHRARLEGLGECWIFRDAGDGRLWLHGFFD